MKLELSQRIAPSLQHRMRLQLFQRMQILAKPSLELRHEMAAALADNPALIGMCESTVSRVTSRKYAETPQGFVELKQFFGAGIPGVNGAEVAPEAAKEMIRRLVALEDPARPLSDQQIMSRLRSDHGVVIARRTVAKYRDVLGIAGSSVRRQ